MEEDKPARGPSPRRRRADKHVSALKHPDLVRKALKRHRAMRMAKRRRWKDLALRFAAEPLESITEHHGRAVAENEAWSVMEASGVPKERASEGWIAWVARRSWDVVLWPVGRIFNRGVL